MGGLFGVVSKENCIQDLFYGTDYHSHLGTRRGGLVELWIHEPAGGPTALADRPEGAPVHAREVARSLLALLETSVAVSAEPPR